MKRIILAAIAAASISAAHAQTPRTWYIINATHKACEPMTNIGNGSFPTPLAFMNGLRIRGTVDNLSSDGSGTNQIVVFSATNPAWNNERLTFTMVADYQRCVQIKNYMVSKGQLLSDGDLQ